MHKKRLVLFREPPAHKKFSNSQIKELTGGGRRSLCSSLGGARRNNIIDIISLTIFSKRIT
jgi:hypothetical protein